MVVTGNFDDWSLKDGVLKKQDSDGFGSEFVGEIHLNEPQRLVFKFVVNGSQWITSPKYKIEHDVHGNANNYLEPEDLTEVKDEPASSAVHTSETDTTDGVGHAAKEATTDSQFVALSTPEDRDDTAGELEKPTADRGPPPVSEPRHRNAPIDIPAPTTANPGPRPSQPNDPTSDKSDNSGSGDCTSISSIVTGGFIGTKQPGSPTQQESDVSTLGANSWSSYHTGHSHKGNTDPLVVSALGLLPDPSEERKSRGRGVGIVSRLMGFFH